MFWLRFIEIRHFLCNKCAYLGAPLLVHVGIQITAVSQYTKSKNAYHANQLHNEPNTLTCYNWNS